MTTGRLQRLTDLESRLASATGADRELDRSLWFVAIPKTKELWPHWSSAQRNGLLPHYTDSLDAALQLKKAVLPGADWIIAKGQTRDTEPSYGMQIFAPHSGRMVEQPAPIGESEAPTAPLALCLAIVRALIAQEKGKGNEATV